MKHYRSPNYCLKESHIYWLDIHDSKTLEAGSFVRPIEECYVPKHVLEDKKWTHYNKDKHVFCYTRWGFVMVPRNIIREI